MIDRYSLPEIAAIWSETHKLAVWHEIEALALEAWSKEGVVPAEVADAVRQATAPTLDQVTAREEATNHDLAAFVDLLGESAGGEAAAWVHYGLTSSDVIDTATGAILRDSADVLLARTGDLLGVVKSKALEHESTLMIGRTHGMWAEPTTFGLKLATWAFELERGYQRLAAARAAVAVGKISGAVGTYAHVPPSIEEHVCAALGLRAEPASSQVTARDRHAQYLQAIALMGASIERFATEIRHLQRSEVSEVRESFGVEQKGSSAMPHKRNPILSERMTGLARLLRGYSQVGLENVALWHERDISHSSAERVALPDASITLHYMLVKFAEVVEGLVVDGERMKANLEATNGLIYSQAVLLALVGAGMTRDAAYRMVQTHALAAWDGGDHLRTLLAADPDLPLSSAALDDCFTTERFLTNAGVVMERLRVLELG